MTSSVTRAICYAMARSVDFAKFIRDPVKIIRDQIPLKIIRDHFSHVKNILETNRAFAYCYANHMTTGSNSPRILNDSVTRMYFKDA